MEWITVGRHPLRWVEETVGAFQADIRSVELNCGQGWLPNFYKSLLALELALIVSVMVEMSFILI